MPPPDHADELAELVSWVGRLPAPQRERLYLELLARGHVTARIAPARPPAGSLDQTPSESLPRDQRDFLRRGLEQMTRRNQGAQNPVLPVVSSVAHEAQHQAVETARRFAEHSEIRLLVIARRATIDGSSERQRVAAQIHKQLSSELAQISKSQPFSLIVGFEPERSPGGKRGYRRMDFPVYLCGPNTGADYLERTMDEHGVPAEYAGKKLKDVVTRNWAKRGGDYGVAVPPIPGKGSFAKLVFLDFTRIETECPKDLAVCVANTTLHEFAHAAGLSQEGTHERSGGHLMQSQHMQYWGTEKTYSAATRQRLETFLLAMRLFAVRTP